MNLIPYNLVEASDFLSRGGKINMVSISVFDTMFITKFVFGSGLFGIYGGDLPSELQKTTTLKLRFAENTGLRISARNH